MGGFRLNRCATSPPFVLGMLHGMLWNQVSVSGLLGRPLEDGLHAGALGLHALFDRAEKNRKENTVRMRNHDNRWQGEGGWGGGGGKPTPAKANWQHEGAQNDPGNTF